MKLQSITNSTEHFWNEQQRVQENVFTFPLARFLLLSVFQALFCFVMTEQLYIYLPIYLPLMDGETRQKLSLTLRGPTMCG